MKVSASFVSNGKQESHLAKGTILAGESSESDFLLVCKFKI